MMSKVKARILTEDDHDQWDRLVGRSEHGTIFHSSAWITTSAKVLHFDYVIIGVFNGTELIGGCVFYIKTLFSVLKIGYTNIPLTPWGGFVLSMPKSNNKIHRSEVREREIIFLILEKIQTLNLLHITIVNSPAFNDIRPIKWQGWTESVFYSYIVSLDNDIFLNFSSNTRARIRKSRKLGITVKKEYDPYLFWKLAELTYRKQNMEIPFQKEHLFKLMEMLKQNNLGEMWIAEMPTGEAISAVFNIYDTHLAFSWLGANNPQFKNTGVTSLLLFETYKDLKTRGFHRVNLMGANVFNLASFYSEFNPRLVPYYGVQVKKRMKRLLNLMG